MNIFNHMNSSSGNSRPLQGVCAAALLGWSLSAVANDVPTQMGLVEPAPAQVEEPAIPSRDAVALKLTDDKDVTLSMVKSADTAAVEVKPLDAPDGADSASSQGSVLNGAVGPTTVAVVVPASIQNARQPIERLEDTALAAHGHTAKDDQPLSYALVLALIALIGLVPVSRRRS